MERAARGGAEGRERGGGRSGKTRYVDEAWKTRVSVGSRDRGTAWWIRDRWGRGRSGRVVPVPEAQRRPFFTARTSVSGPRSPRNTNKNGGRGRWGKGEGRRERYGAKEENGKDGNQVPRDIERGEGRRGTRGGKRTTLWLDDTAAVLSYTRRFFYSLISSLFDPRRAASERITRVEYFSIVRLSLRLTPDFEKLRFKILNIPA